MWETWVQSLGWEDPLEEDMATHSSMGKQYLIQKSILELEIHSNPFSPGKSHGQRSLVGYSPWSHKKSDMTEQLSTEQL